MDDCISLASMVLISEKVVAGGCIESYMVFMDSCASSLKKIRKGGDIN